MKIRKRLLGFVFVALTPFYVHAQNTVSGIIVELSSGQKVEYRLADNPKLVFDGQTVTLTTDKVRVEYKPTELAKVTPVELEKTTGIEQIETETGAIKLESDFVRLSGFAAGETVRVSSISGSQTAAYQIASDGSLVIPLSSLPSGITVIKVNQQSIKIIRK